LRSVIVVKSNLRVGQSSYTEDYQNILLPKDFLEIGFEIGACANSVYQAFLLPLHKRLGTRLTQRIHE